MTTYSVEADALRKAKIVCTLGPATDTLEAVEALIDAGMDVARLNFSHGNHKDHKRRLALVREAAERAGKAVAVLQDLQGPKIRTGRMRGGQVRLVEGREIAITTEEVLGTQKRISTTYEGL